MNLYETLKETLTDCETTQTKSDSDVIRYLKFILSLKTDEKSYDAFVNGFHKNN